MAKLFEDNQGNFSFMRLTSAAIVLDVLFILNTQAWRGDDLDWTGAISMVTVALGAKATQKHMENKHDES